MARGRQRPWPERRAARCHRRDRPRTREPRRGIATHRLPRVGALPLPRGRRSQGGGSRERRRWDCATRRSGTARRRARGARRGGRVRACRWPPPVRRARRARCGARLARVARGAAARPLASAPRRRGCPARVEPVLAARRRLPALLRRRRRDLRRHAAGRPRTRGLSGLARARAAHRRLDRVRSRHRAGHVAPVPPDLSRHRPGERRRGPRGRGGVGPRAPDSRNRAVRAAGGLRARVAQRVGRVARCRVRSRVREPARRADHLRTLGGGARSGRGRGSRLCLDACRASAR